MFYTIGDVHGQIVGLRRALALIAEDGGANIDLYFVGDLVDRGPDSRGVIQMLIDGQSEGRPWHCILGNHDLMFREFVETAKVEHEEIKSGNTWLHHRLGGAHTLASYFGDRTLDHPDWISWEHALEHGLDPASPSLRTALAETARDAVPQAHLDWIAGLPLWIDAAGEHRFVHAGLRPKVPMADQTRSDLTWIRDGWLEHEAPHDAMIVHGHTALDFPQHHGNRINIDGGAGYGRPLVPCGFDGKDWFTLDETGRTPLVP